MVSRFFEFIGKNKMMVVVAIIVGVSAMAISIAYIGDGSVRQVKILLPEQVKQTVAFEDEDRAIQLQ